MEKKEVSLVDLAKIAFKWIYVLIAGMLVFGAAFNIYSKNFVKLEYQAKTKYCIQTRGQSIESDVLASQRDVAYAQLVLGTYIDILNTRDFADEVAYYMSGKVREGDSTEKKEKMAEIIASSPDNGKKYDAKTIKSMITYESEEEKTSFDILVRTDSPDEAYKIAQCIETIASDYIEAKYPGVGVVTVIDKAIPSGAPVNDRVLLMTIAGMLFGALVAFFVVYIFECSDTRIKDEKNLAEKTGIAVIGIIPDMNVENSRK